MSRARTESRHGTASSYSSHSSGFGGRPRFIRGPRLDRRFLGFDLGRYVIDAFLEFANGRSRLAAKFIDPRTVELNSGFKRVLILGRNLGANAAATPMTTP